MPDVKSALGHNKLYFVSTSPPPLAIFPNSYPPALLLDQYALTMLDAAVASADAQTLCTFEVFTRSLPVGRRYGVFAGVGRLLETLPHCVYSSEHLEWLIDRGTISQVTAQWLATFKFSGSIWGYAEGEVFFPNSPVLTVRAPFAECVLLETLILSILNHDSAIASAAARMVGAACGKPVVELGSRRTHESAAVAAARAAYLAGFESTSNMAAGFAYGVPTIGTSAHAFTLLYDDEERAFEAQVASQGPATTLLIDTFDSVQAARQAVEVAGVKLGGVRIDSGNLDDQATHVRAQLDAKGAVDTHIVATGDLDERRIDALKASPIDVFGVGTSLVTGSGCPTAGMVFKIAEKFDGTVWQPVAKASPDKQTVGGRKWAARELTTAGVADRELVVVSADEPHWAPHQRALVVPYVVDGAIDDAAVGASGLAAARSRCAASLAELPVSARSLAHGLAACQTALRGLSDPD